MSGPRPERPRRVIGPRSRQPGWRLGRFRLPALRRPSIRLPWPPSSGSGSAREGGPAAGAGPAQAGFRLPRLQLPRLRLPGSDPGAAGGAGVTRPSWLTPRKPVRLGAGRPGEPQRPVAGGTESGSAAGGGAGDRPWRAGTNVGGPPDGSRRRALRVALGAVDEAVESTGAGGAATAELLVLSVALVAISRLAEGPALWACAVLTFIAHVLAALEVLGSDAEAAGVAADEGLPIEALVTPGLASLAAIGALRLVPVGWLMIPALAGAGALVAAGLAVERRVLVRPAGPTDSDRLLMLSLLILIAFLGFAGIAAAIPGALAEPAASGAARALPLSRLGLLAGADGIIAGLVGYRLAALRAPSLRAAAFTAVTYAVVVAIAAAALRALSIPLLLGPALLALVTYLWSAYRGAPRSGRRDRRWIVELVALAVLGVLVIAWNLLNQA